MIPGRRAAGWARERELFARGFRLVAGVDEVGRGCLAGPVVAAAVVLDPRRPIAGLRDSKMLTPRARAVLAERVAQCATACGLGVVEAVEIDRTDILSATLLAMRQAVEALPARPEFLLVDAARIPGTDLPQEGIVRGDQSSVSIAAASIVAKVFRDGLMCSFHTLYPSYRFDANKGYGTPVHLAALRRLGPTPLHRATFRGVLPAAGPAPARAGARSA